VGSSIGQRTAGTKQSSQGLEQPREGNSRTQSTTQPAGIPLLVPEGLTLLVLSAAQQNIPTSFLCSRHGTVLAIYT